VRTFCVIISVNYFNDTIRRAVRGCAIGKPVVKDRSRFRNSRLVGRKRIGTDPGSARMSYYICLRRTSQDISVPKSSRSLLRIYEPASRGKHWQSIGAVCCRVTSARSGPMQNLGARRIPPYCSPGRRGHARFAPKSIITRVLYCLTLTQLLSNNASERALAQARVSPSRASIELFDLLLFFWREGGGEGEHR